MHSLFRQIKKTYRMAKPHERKTVLKNFASLSVLQAITYLLPVLILPYLFRVLGPSKFGLIAFAQAFGPRKFESVASHPVCMAGLPCQTDRGQARSLICRGNGRRLFSLAP